MLGFHSFFFITHINGKESFNFGFCFVFPKKKKNSRNVLLASEQYSCIYFIINWPRGLYVWTSCTSTYIHLSSIYHPTSLASCPPFKLKGRLQITKHREPMWAALMSLLVVPVVGRVSKKKKELPQCNKKDIQGHPYHGAMWNCGCKWQMLQLSHESIPLWKAQLGEPYSLPQMDLRCGGRPPCVINILERFTCLFGNLDLELMERAP